MDLNPRDRLALRAALAKLSASAEALAEASQQISGLITELAVPTLVDAPAAPPTSAVPVPAPARQPRQVTVPRRVPHLSPDPGSASWPYTGREHPAKTPVHGPAPRYPVPAGAPAPLKAPMSTEAKIMRGVAIGGAAITIAGIILLVSVAVQRGWLGPLGRVIGSYLLAAALFGAAAWLRSRSGRTEAVVALTVTSQVAATATTFALGFTLEWWPPGITGAVILAINAGYLLLGRFWSGPAEHDQARDTAVFTGAAVLTGLIAWLFSPLPQAPLPLYGVLVALLLSWGRSTRMLRGVLAAFAVALQLLCIDAVQVLPHVTVLGVITPVVLAVLTLRDPLPPRHPDRGEQSARRYWLLFESHPVAAWAGAVAPALIVLALGPILVLRPGIWWLLAPAIGIALAGVLALDRDRVPATVHTRRSATLISVTGLSLIAVALVFIRYNGPVMTPQARLLDVLPVLVFMLGGGALLLWQRTLPTDRSPGVVPWLVWLAAAVAITGVLFRNVVTLSPVWLTDTSALIQALAILVFITAVVLARATFYHQPLWLQLLVGSALLYLSATAIVTVVTFLGHALAGTAGMHLGFVIGHAGVSILWMGLAAGLMLSRRLLEEPGALWTGVALAVAGTLKLVFFDLVALEGVPRAIAFLLSGIALLSIAAMRGRRVDKPAPH